MSFFLKRQSRSFILNYNRKKMKNLSDKKQRRFDQFVKHLKKVLKNISPYVVVVKIIIDIINILIALLGN